jgi:hypothetical protein
VFDKIVAGCGINGLRGEFRFDFYEPGPVDDLLD